MNTYSHTLYNVKKTKSGSDEMSQGQYRGYQSKYSLGQVQTTNYGCRQPLQLTVNQGRTQTANTQTACSTYVRQAFSACYSTDSITSACLSLCNRYKQIGMQRRHACSLLHAQQIIFSQYVVI